MIVVALAIGGWVGWAMNDIFEDDDACELATELYESAPPLHLGDDSSEAAYFHGVLLGSVVRECGEVPGSN